MRIGIDFRVFQVGHQFRGIGQVAAQALGQLEARIPSDDEIVLFVDSNGPDITGRADALFPEGRARRIIMWQDPRFPRLAKLRGPSTDAREQQVSANCDAFIQFDFMLGIPASVPTLVVIYDQIPILLGDRFPTSYRPHLGSARAAGLPMKHAVYKAGTRMIYEKMLAGALSRAKTVLTISRHTATTTLDFASKAGLTGIDAKVESAHLGWDHADHTAAKPGLTTMTRYRMEGLGLHVTPFVFFMGGTDDRRRIDDLVAAFNRLRADGRELKLVLAGYDFVSVDRVLSEATRRELEASSYGEDIHLLGFVDDTARAWLYAHAEAFVFPSLHEGFGLPVVESLGLGCTVVAYDNTSISEVAGPNCILVREDWQALAPGIAQAMDRDPDTKRDEAAKGTEWANRFTWDDFGSAVANFVESVRLG